jgi:hypothetical protein
MFQSPPERRHPERSASQIYRTIDGFMARSRRTPAVLDGRCSSELSGHRLQGKLKKSQPPTGAHPDFLLRGTHQRPRAAFRKESRMKVASATNLYRKSGVAQWRACPACSGVPRERSRRGSDVSCTDPGYSTSTRGTRALIAHSTSHGMLPVRSARSHASIECAPWLPSSTASSPIATPGMPVTSTMV